MFLGPETKDRGTVAGVRSFVEGLRDKEWQSNYSICFVLKIRCGGSPKRVEFTAAKAGS